MRLRFLPAALAACVSSFAVRAGSPPSLDRYSVNLGVLPGVPAFVYGQMPFWIDTTDTSVNAFGLPRPVSDQSRFPVTDSSGGAFQGVVAIMPGTPTTAQRSVGFICTSAGNVTLTLADGSTLTVAVAASSAFQSLPFAVTNVALGAGTAATFWGLK